MESARPRSGTASWARCIQPFCTRRNRVGDLQLEPAFSDYRCASLVGLAIRLWMEREHKDDLPPCSGNEYRRNVFQGADRPTRQGTDRCLANLSLSCPWLLWLTYRNDQRHGRQHECPGGCDAERSVDRNLLSEQSAGHRSLREGGIHDPKWNLGQLLWPNDPSRPIQPLSGVPRSQARKTGQSDVSLPPRHYQR